MEDFLNKSLLAKEADVEGLTSCFTCILWEAKLWKLVY